MANQSLNFFSTTSIDLLSGDELFIGTTGALFTNNASVFDSGVGDHEIVILGSIFSTSAWGVQLDQATQVEMVIGQTATISGQGFHGIELIATTAVDVQNFGIVTSTIGFGLNILNGDATATAHVVNNGSLVGNDNSMGVEAGGLSIASGTAAAIVNNTGIITGARGILGGVQSGMITIQNTGTISGTTNDAIETGSPTTLTNTGIINGNIDLVGGSDSIVNSGTINGDINLGTSNDVFRSFGGTVTGTIDGGSNNDTFYIDQPVAVIIGGLGNDTIFARADVLDASEVEDIRLQGAGDFSVIGDFDTTVIVGNLGGNALFGAASATTINGGGGDDEISGGAGNDTLVGGTGNDVILGGADGDLIVGGTGNDTIQGGTGRDILLGQQGADTFVYETPAELGNGAARDIINGFNRGADVIDVSAINDASFAFIGTAVFSGGGTMELRYRVVAGTNVIVEIDENGDGVIDGSLNLRGITMLDADDFVL